MCDLMPNYFRTMTVVFSGWQYQVSPPTIQCHVEKALIRVTKLERKDLRLAGAGRTDTGVHAWGQVWTFYFFLKIEELSNDWPFSNSRICKDFRWHTSSPRSTTKAWKAFTQLLTDFFLRTSELEKLAPQSLNSMPDFQQKARPIITRYTITSSWIRFSVVLLTTVLISSTLLSWEKLPSILLECTISLLSQMRLTMMECQIQ